MDTAELTKTAFDKIQEDAPPDVPRWDQLHEVERKHLLLLIEAIIDEVISRKWRCWIITYETTPLRSINTAHVMAPCIADARHVLQKEVPHAKIRTVELA